MKDMLNNNLKEKAKEHGKKVVKSNITNTIASAILDVTQGTGAHYYNAKSNASQTDVKLGAENNNNSPNTYAISGYWDEETNQMNIFFAFYERKVYL